MEANVAVVLFSVLKYCHLYKFFVYTCMPHKYKIVQPKIYNLEIYMYSLLLV